MPRKGGQVPVIYTSGIAVAQPLRMALPVEALRAGSSCRETCNNALALASSVGILDKAGF